MIKKRYDKTKNSLRNSVYGIVLRLINLFGAFVLRTMLIHSMGIEFVGLDGLFSSLLQFLSLAELGFSSAIVFKLYKPMAEGDDEKVCSLLTYYRSIYRAIGAIILGIGVVILPILPKLVGGENPPGINIYALYLIYLINTCLSYWLFAYRTAILSAAQRNDLQSKASSVVLIFKYAVQVLVLLFVKNYYAYVLIIPATTLMTNICNMWITNKYFPQYVCKGKIDKEDKKEINQKVSALMYNKLGVALINGSQNVIISTFTNLTVLGIYNSYYYIFSMLYSFFDVFHTAITGGIGNSIVTESKETNYKLFRKIGFVNNWVTAWCSICLLCLYRPFMIIWLGRDNTLTHSFSLLMALYFYCWMIRFVTAIFKSAQGLWVEDRFRALIEGVTTLALGVALVRYIGVYGVVVATIVAQLLVSLPWETRVLYKKYFGVSDRYFYFDFLGRFLVSAIAGGAAFILCLLIKLSPLMTLVIDALICISVPNIIFYIFYRKSEGYAFLRGLMIKTLSILKKNKWKTKLKIQK